MAYSNTNRDKLQQKSFMAVKTTLLTIVLIAITGSSLMNTYNQWQLLNQAMIRNRTMEAKIDQLETKNKQLEQQIEYATSSAYIKRKTKEYLGLGGVNDYWLILPKEDGESELKPEINETADVPTIIEWWNLFTK